MDIKKIEKKAQQIWEDRSVFQFKRNKKLKKSYILDMFPYPSGEGLHVGHIKGYTATDIVSHYMRLRGFDVLHPMGWDAFGLPAENYALKIKKNPREVVRNNISRFKKQMKMLGFSYDWSREINTTDSNYYKWTQWIFLKMFEQGLAYEENVAINFCPSCKTGLANEEVVAGRCERCKTKVEKKKIRQWVLKITKYADKLLEGLEDLDWPEPIKMMQKNWIGRSEGSNIFFAIKNINLSIEVFTTRADTLFGCTYLVLSPEYKNIEKIINASDNKDEIKQYVIKARCKNDIDRANLKKEKTGVKFKGIKAINPVNNKEIDVFVADYVLSNYGTGAVMAVPAHDCRDFEFAKKYGLEIKESVVPQKGIRGNKLPFTEYGYLINSGKFDAMRSKRAISEITKKLISEGRARFGVNYKLRDWIFSRQRYWGEPIPIVHCPKCGAVGVSESDLPVMLPDVKSYEPTGDGQSPLRNITDWVKTKCPQCGGDAERETNTMPQWAGSCWYYLRYLDPQNDHVLVDTAKEKEAMPVDLYVGGAEHAVLHLLYARFYHKFLFENKIVSNSEPFKKLRNVGIILAPDGQKMSKSRGNVINPDELADQYGSDSLRMYEMFIGPFEQSAMWNKGGIVGTHSFIKKVVNSFDKRNNVRCDFTDVISNLEKSVSKKIESMQLNTIISDFMKFINSNKLKSFDDQSWKRFIICLAPLAPHTSEYLWQNFCPGRSVFENKWIEQDSNIINDTCIVIQVNGKKRGLIEIKKDYTDKKINKLAVDFLVKKGIINKSEIDNKIYIKNKLINFVVKK